MFKWFGGPTRFGLRSLLPLLDKFGVDAAENGQSGPFGDADAFNLSEAPFRLYHLRS